MTDIRLNLGLFSEAGTASQGGGAAQAESGSAGGASDGSAARESASPSPSRKGEATSSEAEAMAPDTSGASAPATAGATTEDAAEATADSTETDIPAKSDTERICEALGLDGITAEELIALVNSRRQRSELIGLMKEQKAAKEYERLVSESAAFAEKFKGFDIRRELCDRRFGSLIHAGFSVEDAWRATHFDEIIRAATENAARTARESALEKLRETAGRPEENGGGGASPAKTSADVRALTGRGIRDILRRVEKGAKIKF